jgi:chemotaxis protein MotB
MMALLLCFFVMLFAMSDVNEVELMRFLESFGNPNINVVQASSSFGMQTMLGSGIIHMPAPDPDANAGFQALEIYDDMSDRLMSLAIDFETFFHESRTGLDDGTAPHEPPPIDIVYDPELEELRIIFGDNMLFASASAEVLPATLYLLDYVAQILIDNPEFLIFIEGHTDNVPMRAGHPIFPTNWHLSASRAIAVLSHLEAQGVEPYRLIPIGFGEHNPRGDNNTEEGRAQNRRVEIRITQ